MSNITLSTEPAPALLRKMTQPLYDTNILANAVAPALYQFFVLPVGVPMPVTGVNKTLADTNMSAASMLGNPNQFDIVGFNFEMFVHDPTDVNDNAEDLFQLYQASVFTFFFGNNKVWLQLPLSQIPTGTALTGTVSSGDITANDEAMFLHQGLAQVDQVYDFTVRKRAIRIHPNENFRVEINWPNGGTAVWQWATSRCRVFIQGSMYAAL